MPILADAVTSVGCEVAVRPWDDPTAAWGEVDLAVVRSPWDYPVRMPEFRAWIDWCAKTGVKLANSPDVLRWNIDKRYLKDLADAGVPTVPTTYIDPGAEIRLPIEGEFVVKPAVGAGSRLAGRYGAADQADAARHVARLQAEGLTVMVQPYRDAVDTAGERALVFFGGRFMHAIRKRGVLALGADIDGPREAHPGLVSWQPSAEELALGRQALAAVPFDGDLVYGRVDLIVEPDRGPVLMELELIEPNLFLRPNPGAAMALARVIAERATGNQHR
ncbi:ATP-grasp domain-containing protein [Micromonospora sp. NPDC047753]|uniref:ATP-grasp domain-containing protein n=1 Tax=Micromonospora TaxID=1873 RepID=UPI00340E0BD3